MIKKAKMKNYFEIQILIFLFAYHVCVCVCVYVCVCVNVIGKMENFLKEFSKRILIFMEMVYCLSKINKSKICLI